MRLRTVSFRYSRRDPWILQDLGLTLEPGSVVEVTGRNGAGKSTLLRLLAGIVPPTRGTIADRPAAVGYAPDVFPVDQPFTVTAYLAHMSRIRSASPAVIGELAARLGATHLLDKPLGDLSKGSAQKIGLIQALLVPPGLLILDEPFAGLDEQTRTALPAIIDEIASAGGTVVVSDHQNQLRDLPGAEHWLVDDGTVTPGARLPSPREDASPGGAPRQTIIEVIVDADDADEVEQKLRADGYLTRRSS
ncbi:ABC-type multidrug transport system ATPase subunit [Streptosporangium becharense]|uniref:ABC-type multidrug transport system ATPase subunit n=1 Tax=Streptosporangium becharense TaxID=1816182 RepID=A0A7W9MG13_9ACTN|nr:ATP-binding cassette domain-containing protein [Streptosporangium becharense]MBB2910076.1 ABC-type multidrug transport system ATPase subunit [Streptosporangium becharense]MBB5818969.1 ABC-type multidrug transport system ATPase subunit [Streptosporangium becharense]